MGRLGRLEERDTGHVGGRYRLLEKLGTGGMSVVWRGYDEILGREVAVKVLSAQLADDRTFRDRLRQEALSAARLCHPHITGIFDYGESPVATRDGADGDDVAVPYVVMELNDGESVSTRLARRGPLAWRDAVTVAAEVASALATAHARGVVHRDVTPANVMLTSAGAKVVDFGISALIGERDTAPDGSLLGTPAYLAPERLAGGQVSPATDVYALGLLLYRSLTGRLPWPAETTTEVLRAHLYADPEPIPSQSGMPAVVAELCLRCLAKAPADRPDASAVAHTLAAVVGLPAVLPSERPAAAPAARRVAPVARRTWRQGWHDTRLSWQQVWRHGWARRLLRAGHRRVHAAAATVALLAVVGVAWVSSQQPGDVGPAQAAAAGAGAAVAVEHPTRCRVRYQMRRDTGTTFDVSLAVTIIGQHALDGWVLEFAFPGNQRLTSLTGPVGDLEQVGRSVAIRPAAGVELQSGKAFEVFLHGAYEQVNPLPLEFALDGRACHVMVLGTPVTPPPVTAPADGASDTLDEATAVREASDRRPRTPVRTSTKKPDRSRTAATERAPEKAAPEKVPSAGGTAAGAKAGDTTIVEKAMPSKPPVTVEPPTDLRIRPQRGFAA
jgi:serine/threonine-protein kinase